MSPINSNFKLNILNDFFSLIMILQEKLARHGGGGGGVGAIANSPTLKEEFFLDRIYA